ncbi:MAG: tetratricopeptide repeat protein, partial [Candidatus Latescibacterota bacterium]
CLARRRSPLLATLFFALMALSHWATVALSPALLFLWMERGGRIFARLPRRLPEIGAALVFLLPTTLSEARLFYIAQPWTAHGGYAPYGILSKAYLLLRANFALLLVPVPILLFLFRLGEPGRTGEGAPPLLRFLRTAALSAIAESAAIRAFLGPCDWDLFSFFAGPVALWAAARAATRAREEDLRPLALLAAAVGLFTLAPWVIGNTSVEGGAKRVARMVHDDPQHYVGRKPRAVALAWVMAERGAPETAFALFRHVAEKRPDNAIARADLGILYFQRGMYREAAPHLEEAVRLDPSLDPPLYYLGAVRFHMKEGDFGEDALRRFLDRVPGNPSAESYLGRVLLLDARWEEALGHLLGAYRALPGNADLNAWIALALVRLGRIDEARSHVERALRTDPDHADARRLLDEVRDGGGGSGATRPRGGR